MPTLWMLRGLKKRRSRPGSDRDRGNQGRRYRNKMGKTHISRAWNAVSISEGLKRSRVTANPVPRAFPTNRREGLPTNAGTNCTAPFAARDIQDPALRFQLQGFMRERRLAAPESSEAIKQPANSAPANLPLAAGPCVGHIGLNGAVAEWLKAAVC
jgi:hypothetical protein